MEQVPSGRSDVRASLFTNQKPTVRREAPSQRRFFRLTAPIWVSIQGKTYRATNWSRGGFLISDQGLSVPPGKTIACRVVVSFQGYEISFVTKISSAWTNPQERQTAFSFVSLNEKQNELLEFFAKGLVSGEMAAFAEAIKRVDIPVTPINEEPDFDEASPFSPNRFRRLSIGSVYLAGGLLIGGYVASSVYSTLFEINVETAVVSAPMEIIHSPVAGTIETVDATLDRELIKGAPLIRIRDPSANEDLELARIGLEIEKSELRQKENALRTVREIGTSRIEIAKTRIATVKEQLALAEKTYARLNRLRKSGLVSEMEREQAANKATTLRADLAAAKADLTIATRGVGNANDGRMYAALEIKGDLPELEMAVQYARQRVTLEEEKFKAMQTRIAQLQVNAPFDGHVTRFFVSPGSTVEKGQAIAIIEHATQRYVDAFLTQTEIDRMSIKDPAYAVIPALDRELRAKVARIDRTSGLVDGQLPQLRWPDGNTRSARVVLEFDADDLRTDGAPIPSGLPVFVTFKKNPILNWLPH